MNQLTRLDRVYDEVGALFLAAFNRRPQTLDEIVETLYAQLHGVSLAELHADAEEFAESLVTDGFVVAGERAADLDAADPCFSYAVEEPKTVGVRFVHRDPTPVAAETAEFLYEHFRRHPTLFGIHLEISSRCNQRCVHCYQVPKRQQDMPTSLARELLARLSALGTISVTLSGGEPTLHADIEELLRQARRHDFVINLLTNGTMMPESLIATLQSVNVNAVQVSLYSTDPAVHDAITRVPGSHARTSRAIERLVAADIPVQVSCPVMRQNLAGYAGLARWCQARKVRLLSDFILMARTDFDQGNLAGRLDLAETRELIHTLVDAQPDYGEQLALPLTSQDPERYAQQPVCGVGIDNACITAEGLVYPCSGFQGLVVGDVRHDSLSAIWADSPELQALRSVTNAAFPACLQCDARDYCAMCLVRNYNESGGDMFAISPHYCAVARINEEVVEERVWGLGSGELPVAP